MEIRINPTHKSGQKMRAQVQFWSVSAVGYTDLVSSPWNIKGIDPIYFRTKQF